MPQRNENCQKVKFEGTWDELEVEKFLQRQRGTKYLRQTLNLM